MPWVYLDLPLMITVKGPLHIGTGYDRGLTQRTMARDAQGNVYIPGASLKGKVRNACEDLARRCDLTVCGLPRVAEAPKTTNHQPERCLVCRVFGASGGNVPDGRRLFWHDAHLTEEWHRETTVRGRPEAWPVGQTMARTQVQLSRARGMAAEDRLYTSEFTARGLEFVGRVSGWLMATPCSADTGYYEVNLLLAGLRLVETLGGGRSRGAGHCQIKLPAEVVVRVAGQEKPEKYALTDLLAAAESLGLFSEEEGGEESGA
jgi:CRISPR/Cas system CSM-associated protein Csm3 (group 7 of RAMP superfamily)